MSKHECWNCGEEIGEDWNFCTQCTYPVDPDIMVHKLLEWKKKEKNMIDKAPELVAEGIANRFPEEKIREMLEENHRE